jgi:hypothetical protein
MRFDRHYHMRPSAIWWMRASPATWCTFIVIALLDNQGGTFGVAFGVGCVVAIVAVWIRAEASWPRVGLYESPDGLEAVGLNMFGGVRILTRMRWEQIVASSRRARRSVA